MNDESKATVELRAWCGMLVGVSTITAAAGPLTWNEWLAMAFVFAALTVASVANDVLRGDGWRWRWPLHREEIE